MEEIFLARQPIYNGELDVSFYEILFRSGHQSNAAGAIFDGDKATSQVLINLFAEMGEENVTNNQPAFINLTRNLLLSDIVKAFPKDKVVVEVLEDMTIDDNLIKRVHELSNAGYQIALDDFVYSEEWKPLMETANFIKLDVFEKDEVSIVAELEHLKDIDCKLLAEKIEDHDMYDLCNNLGFEFFQGYFLCKPHIIAGKHLPANKTVLLNLIAELQSPDATPDRIATLLSQDASLSVKILRILNSASFSLARKIESMKDAVVMLGRERITNLANLILLTNISDKPNELMKIAMTRAKHCSLLAERLGLTPDTYFTVGLFSTLDALLDKPMGELLEKMPFNDDVKAALLGESSVYGKVLADVVHYERGEWASLNSNKLTSDDYKQTYLHAVQWMTETCPFL